MGSIKGLGSQSKASIVVLIGYYFIGIPVGTYLAFGEFKMLLRGVWIGQSAAIGFNMVVYFLLLFVLIDWKKQAEISEERSRKEKEKQETAITMKEDSYKKVDEAIN